MNSEYLVSGDQSLQFILVAVLMAVAVAYTGGWFRWLQQRREINVLDGKLSVAKQANLEKVAELSTLANALNAFSQGLLWSLTSAVESHLRTLRK